MKVLLSHSRAGVVERFRAAWEKAGGSREELVAVAPQAEGNSIDRGGTPAGLLLAGGPDVEPWRYGQSPLPQVELHINPSRDDLDLDLLRRADERGWPVLGVCYGCQVLAVARGGTLIQDLPNIGVLGHRCGGDRDTLAHEVEMLAPRFLTGMPARFRVNSRHHQAIDDPGRLRVVARSPDGVIEAVEGNEGDRFVVGVQWHPEDLLSEPHLELFRRFRAACLERG